MSRGTYAEIVNSGIRSVGLEGSLLVEILSKRGGVKYRWLEQPNDEEHDTTREGSENPGMEEKRCPRPFPNPEMK
jgi:hypothetical protein